MDLQTLAAALAISDKRIAASSPSASSEPPDAPKENDLWVDTGVSPTMMRRWRGADVTTEREYTYDMQGCAKNLIPPPASAQTVDGITYTPQADGTVIASGTCSGTRSLALYEGVLPPGEYTISGGADGMQVILAVIDDRDLWVRTIVYSSGGVARTATVNALSGSEAYHRVYLQPLSALVGTQVNNIVVSPQLESGSTATSFEPYKDVPFLALDNGVGQIQSMAVEAGCRAKQLKRRNLLQPVYTTQTINGVTFTVNEDGSVTIDGTATSRAQYSITVTTASRPQVFAGQTFTLFNVEGADQSFYSYAMSVEQDVRLDSSSKTFTMTQDDTLYIAIVVQAGKTVDNVTVYPQLELGSVATEYQPYVEVETISGRESVEVRACGKNLLQPVYTTQTINGVTFTVNSDGSVTINGTATARAQYPITRTTASYPQVFDGQTFTLFDVEGADQSFYSYAMSVEQDVRLDSDSKTFTMTQDDTLYIAIVALEGKTVNNVTVYPQLELGSVATAYEPYRLLGGGEITPSSPLYGLPGAEDTAEVSVDGDVLVTRRTAVLELDGTETNMSVVHTSTGYDRLNIVPAQPVKIVATPNALGNIRCSHYGTVTTGAQWNNGVEGIGVETTGQIMILDAGLATLDAWKTYLAAQAAAGTPVTIVYELAAPETETPADVDPIVPEKGQLNISTDADALSATVHGSGWDTISDQTGLLATIAQLTARVAALEQAAVNESTGG